MTSAILQPPPKRIIKWGEIINGSIQYPVHAGQRDILLSDARFTAAIAGTGGGKTAIGPLWIMRRLKKLMKLIYSGQRDVKKEPILGMAVAPTNQIKDRATVPTLVNMFKDTEFEGVHIPSRNKYVLPGTWITNAETGEEEWIESIGVIWLLSADNPDGLEGGQFDFVWGDEGGQFKYGAMIAIEGRTGLRQAPVLITTTPYGINWLKYRFLDRWKDGDKNYFVRQWKSKDNPAYPEEEYDRAKSKLSAQRAAQRYDGQFVRMAGLVYPDIETCFTEHFTPPDGIGYGGIDFGWNDPFAGLAAVLDERRHLWIYFERYKRETPIGQHSAKMPRSTVYFADPSRPDHIRELRVDGHTVRGAKNDIVIGIDAVNSRIYSKTIHISVRCTALRAEVQEYRYPEKDDEVKGDKPIDDFNHACDALRYLVMGIDKRQVAKNGTEK